MHIEQNIAIYQNDEGNINVEVKIINDDLWLSLNQIAELFGRDKSVISRHLSNIFNDEELTRDSVVAFFATTAQDAKIYQVEHFNLDAIISVGYRVNSKRGAQFRRWSSSVLRSHLTKGYSINKVQIDSKKIKELQQSIELLANTLESQTLIDDMGIEILKIIKQYSKTWDILLRYDEDRLTKPKNNQHDLCILDFDEALKATQELKAELKIKKEASNLFGNMKDNQLEGIILGLNQSFAEEYLYPTNIERAAHLLYFVIKDHPFSDGNKRIGCLLFLIYLHKARIVAPENNSLIAMALLIAESDPKQKNLIIQLIMNLIGK
jgi:prophage maintenance system killer protein